MFARKYAFYTCLDVHIEATSYVYSCVFVVASIHTHAYIHTHTYMHKYIYTYMCVCIYIHTYMHTYKPCIFVDSRTCTCILDIDAYHEVSLTHTCTHTYIPCISCAQECRIWPRAAPLYICMCVWVYLCICACNSMYACVNILT
jgi:hypothetical protein